jgi:hypothetical protein
MAADITPDEALREKRREVERLYADESTDHLTLDELEQVYAILLRGCKRSELKQALSDLEEAQKDYNQAHEAARAAGAL